MNSLREFGIKHNRYIFCWIALIGEKAISLTVQSCSEKMISYSELANKPSVVRIFIVLKMRLLSPNYALLD